VRVSAISRIAAVIVAATVWIPGPLGSATATAPVPDPAAARVVERFHDVLLSVMREAKVLGYRGRYERLAPSVAEAFHIRFMIAVITGHHWRKMTPEQKGALTDAFARMTTSTYARRFDGYDGERFETVSSTAGARNGVLVRTRLITSDPKPVELNYQMLSLGGKWRIVDIHLAGKFSEVATKRSEYSSVLKRKGFDFLLAQINKKIAADENEPR